MNLLIPSIYRAFSTSLRNSMKAPSVIEAVFMSGGTLCASIPPAGHLRLASYNIKRPHRLHDMFIFATCTIERMMASTTKSAKSTETIAHSHAISHGGMKANHQAIPRRTDGHEE